jgi:phage terminase large subunit-like protein
MARKPLSAKWRKLLTMLPGYDPFADPGDSWFDPDEAQRRIDFFPRCLCHIEGPKAGEPFVLEPWQQSYIANLFGWQRKDDSGRTVRRYRESLCYLPRGNGKTTISAGITLSCLLLDNEGGAQCYSAAAEREQAALLMRHAANMIRRAPALDKRCKIYETYKSIVLKSDPASFYRALSADAHTKHGYNAHCVVIDELHAQPNRDLVDVLVSSTRKKRAQPLIVYITTADWLRESICNEVYEYACKVRDGMVSNPRFLPAIYEAKPSDDWQHDEKVWHKANPNLGTSIAVEDFREAVQKAVDIPAQQNTVLRLHFNIRTQNESLAIPSDQWVRCGHGCTDPMAWRQAKLLSLRGRPCFAGLDLGAVNDLTAFVCYFPEESPRVVLPWFWVTADAIERRRKQRVTYDQWVQAGFMTQTEGNVTDYDVVRRDVLDIASNFQVQELGVDRLFQGAQLCTQLAQDGLNIKAFGQGFISMAMPCKRILEMVAAAELDHGANPVLSWHAGNAATETDAAGNIKFSKSKSSEKIDGIVALAQGVGLAEATAKAGPISIEVW